MGELSLPWEHANLTDEMGRKQLVLLAILAIAARPVPREDLATLLWPDSDRQAARHNLRQALVSIRKALGERADAAIIADFDGVALRPHALRTDIGRLREIAAGADTSAGEVLDLCRGPLLEGFSLASHAFEDQLEVWRQEAAALSVMAIDRVLADARPAEREILFVRRQFFVPAQAGQEGPQLPAMRPPAEGAGPRRQSGSSWRRRVAVLVKGLALGTAVVIALLAVPNIRDLIERVLPPPPSITVRSFLSGNDTVVERNLAGLVTGTVTYGLAAVPERKLFVVRAPAEDNVARISDTEFAAELGVRYVITGTLEHDDGTVRVTVN